MPMPMPIVSLGRRCMRMLIGLRVGGAVPMPIPMAIAVVHALRLAAISTSTESASECSGREGERLDANTASSSRG